MQLARLFAAASLSLLAGCGPAPKAPPRLGIVTGVVKLDGRPVSDAIVIFEPKEDGTLASAGTNATGEYQLMYRPDMPGAAVGEHVVRISKRDREAGPETLPTKFNHTSELTAEVLAGQNTINFTLQSN